LVQSTWYQELSTKFRPSTKYLVQSIWYRLLGTKYLVPSPGYQVFCTKHLVPSTWCQVLGTKSLVPSIWAQLWYQVLGIILCILIARLKMANADIHGWACPRICVECGRLVLRDYYPWHRYIPPRRADSGWGPHWDGHHECWHWLCMLLAHSPDAPEPAPDPMLPRQWQVFVWHFGQSAGGG
jgi:hypothetical protein